MNTDIRDARREQDALDALHRLDEECVHLQRTGNYLQAFDRMERALVLRRHFFGPESPEVVHACRALAEMCNLLSMSFLQQDNYGVTLELLKKAEILAQHHPKEKATTLNNLACYYRRLGKLHTAMTCLKKALVIEKKNLHDARHAADTHLNICAVLSQLNKHEQALEHAQSALATLQDEFFHQSTTSNDSTSSTSTTAANNGEALASPQTAQLERVSVMCIAYHNMGVEQEFLKDYENCVLSYKKGVGLAEQYLGVDHAITTTIRNSYLAAKRTISTKSSSSRHAAQATGGKLKTTSSSPRALTPPTSLRLPSPITRSKQQRPELPSPRSIVADALARGNTLPPLDPPNSTRNKMKALSPEDPFFSPRFRFDVGGTVVLHERNDPTSSDVGKVELRDSEDTPQDLVQSAHSKLVDCTNIVEIDHSIANSIGRDDFIFSESDSAAQRNVETAMSSRPCDHVDLVTDAITTSRDIVDDEMISTELSSGVVDTEYYIATATTSEPEDYTNTIEIDSFIAFSTSQEMVKHEMTPFKASSVTNDIVTTPDLMNIVQSALIEDSVIAENVQHSQHQDQSTDESVRDDPTLTLDQYGGASLQEEVHSFAADDTGLGRVDFKDISSDERLSMDSPDVIILGKQDHDVNDHITLEGENLPEEIMLGEIAPDQLINDIYEFESNNDGCMMPVEAEDGNAGQTVVPDSELIHDDDTTSVTSQATSVIFCKEEADFAPVPDSYEADYDAITTVAQVPTESIWIESVHEPFKAAPESHSYAIGEETDDTAPNAGESAVQNVDQEYSSESAIGIPFPLGEAEAWDGQNPVREDPEVPPFGTDDDALIWVPTHASEFGMSLDTQYVPPTEEEEPEREWLVGHALHNDDVGSRPTPDEVTETGGAIIQVE